MIVIVANNKTDIAVRKTTAISKKKTLKPIDIGLLVAIAILLSMGLIMVLSASAPSALTYEGNSYFYFKSQLLNAVIGIVAMLVISKIDYKIYRGRLADIAIIVSIILLILVLVPRCGTYC